MKLESQGGAPQPCWLLCKHHATTVIGVVFTNLAISGASPSANVHRSYSEKGGHINWGNKHWEFYWTRFWATVTCYASSSSSAIEHQVNVAPPEEAVEKRMPVAHLVQCVVSLMLCAVWCSPSQTVAQCLWDRLPVLIFWRSISWMALGLRLAMTSICIIPKGFSLQCKSGKWLSASLRLFLGSISVYVDLQEGNGITAIGKRLAKGNLNEIG